jgi:hypothetical protein
VATVAVSGVPLPSRRHIEPGTSCSPAGSVSLMVTSCAGAEPALCATMANVTRSPASAPLASASKYFGAAVSSDEVTVPLNCTAQAADGE